MWTHLKRQPCTQANRGFQFEPGLLFLGHTEADVFKFRGMVKSKLVQQQEWRRDQLESEEDQVTRCASS